MGFFYFFAFFGFAGIEIANGITNLADVDCGKQLVRLNGRLRGREPKITGGTNAYEGEFPWLVTVKYERVGIVRCGGTIIDNRHVLTSAHCFPQARNGIDWMLGSLVVNVGEHSISKPESHNETRTMQVESLLIHDHFNEKVHTLNDVALLRLRGNLTWGPYTWPACLPDKQSKPEGEIATVAGWGYTSDKELNSKNASQSDLLRKVEVKILDNLTCKEWFWSQNVSWVPKSSQLCAGWKEGIRDSCKGDSGSPLMIKIGKRFSVEGIVAAGKGCGRSWLPGVYTRISSHLDWIQSHIRL